MFYYFTSMCKSLQIFGWNRVVKGGFLGGCKIFLCTLEYSLIKKKKERKNGRCVKAKTKLLYQSDKKELKRGHFVIQQVFYFKRNQVQELERSFKNQLFIFRNTHKDSFIFCFFWRKKKNADSPALLAYSIKCFWQVE